MHYQTITQKYLSKKLHYTKIIDWKCFVAHPLLGALRDIGTVESSMKCISISDSSDFEMSGGEDEVDAGFIEVCIYTLSSFLHNVA